MCNLERFRTGHGQVGIEVPRVRREYVTVLALMLYVNAAVVREEIRTMVAAIALGIDVAARDGYAGVGLIVVRWPVRKLVQIGQCPCVPNLDTVEIEHACIELNVAGGTGVEIDNAVLCLHPILRYSHAA